MSLIYFALLLGPLIFFHEFGHFIVARMFKVTVLEFSIGFGPKLGAFVRNGTVYRIGALPLGGYVKMLGADPMEDIPADQEPGSFASKPLYQRSLIVLAGPVFNFILPLFVFFFLFLSQSQVSPAILGTLQPDGVAARAGLLPGDVIKSINGEEVGGWWELHDLIGGNGGESISMVVERDGEDLPAINLTPQMMTETISPELGLTKEVGRIQIEIAYRKPIIAVTPGSAAAVAGLESWDHILSIDGEAQHRWEYTLRRLQKSKKPMRVTVLRESALPTADGAATFDLATYSPPIELTLDPSAGDGTLGLGSAEFVIYDVTPGSAEARAGLERGDEVISLDGRRLSSWGLLGHEISNKPGDERTLKVRRAGVERDVRVTFEVRDKKGEFNTEMETVIMGMVNQSAYDAPDPVTNNRRIGYALYQTWTRTGSVFIMTAASLAGLFTGQVGLKQMGGPIFIYEVAAKTGEAGWTYFFTVMVWLSISLGLINLVPIPLLDGGHLLFFAIEAIKRGPVSLRTRQVASYIGFSFIILLMLLVFRNDIGRNWDSVIGFFQ